MSASLSAQDFRLTKSDSDMVRRIFDAALEEGQAYSRLGELCKTVGPRLSGSDAAEKGINWAVDMLKSYKFDSVYKQPVMVPRWERGESEELWMYSSVFTRQIKNRFSPDYDCEAFEEQGLKKNKKYRLQAVALGGSIAGKVTAALIVVNSLQELDSLGKIGKIKGKIVLFNRGFDQKTINTFAAYGACVGQRFSGASQAAAYGASAVLVRSMSNRCDLHAHTGSMGYKDGVEKIPAMAVATAVANTLEKLAISDPDLKISMDIRCRTLPDRESSNIISQVKGTDNQSGIIVFGGHFDSWDEGEGAHDDGAGCMHAFDALRILNSLGYKPRHTLRCVWWINEENGLRGGLQYAEQADKKGEKHVAAIESDRGGFTPRGFGIDSGIYDLVSKYKPLLDVYGIGELHNGGGGADIGPLKKKDSSINFVSLIPDSQRYFDIHHAETDVFENVNKRELEMGAAALAVMIWILDRELN